jgi:hypothetical protein
LTSPTAKPKGTPPSNEAPVKLARTQWDSILHARFAVWGVDVAESVARSLLPWRGQIEVSEFERLQSRRDYET